MPDYSNVLDGIPMRMPGVEAGDGAPPPNPDMTYPVMREEPLSPDVRRVGNEGPSSFDYVVEYLPVYLTPSGQEYIGPLEMAPSIPQDSKPIRYVAVPVTPERMT